MQALVPPAMIEIDAVGAIAILQLKRSITPMSAASGHGPALLGEHHRGLVDLRADVLEDLEVPALGHRAFERDVARLEEGVEAHHAEADAALALGAEYLARAISSGARAM